MNKSFLKFLTDFGPLAIFFFYYYNSDKNLSVAIPPLIIATIIALAVVWVIEKKIPPMPLVSGILITFFGGLTIYFNDPIFVYVKPTIINIMFALALLFGKYFTNEPILKKIMGKSIPKNVRPRKDQPFYHLLAENDEITYEAYVSEQNLLMDDSEDPIKHPLIEEIFSGKRGSSYFKPSN